MVRKNKTEMPYNICPKCNRSSPVGKLSGGSIITYYCKDCYAEFWVKIPPNPKKSKRRSTKTAEEKKGPIKITAGLTYVCGMKMSPVKWFSWDKKNNKWKGMRKSANKKKNEQKDKN